MYIDGHIPDCEKKIRLTNFKGWNHHRSGWKDCITALHDFDHPGGILFDSYLDGLFTEGNRGWMSVDFCGFFHLAPRHLPEFADRRYGFGSSVEYMLTCENWLRSEDHCKGLFTVSPYLTKFMRQLTGVPVNTLWHPSQPATSLFSFDKFMANRNKLLVMTGDWLRKFETIYLVDTPNYHKCILQCTKATAETCRRIKYSLPHRYQTVNILGFLPVEAYDHMMSQNVVFLDLHDVCACNSVVDCMMRNTPMLIRRLEGVVDYLGEDYPMYFEDVEEANEKLEDYEVVLRATEYLEQLEVKKYMTFESFRQQFYESEVYRSLPPPSETPTKHPRMLPL